MYYGGSRSYSNGYGRSHTYNYSSDISSLSSRNPSIQRVLNSEYGIRDRSLSPTRDYTSLSRVTAFRPLSSVLSNDSSSALRSSPVSYLNDDFKSRNYYDIQSTSTGMFSSYSPIKKPRRTDYTDYLKPVLSARPMLKSGYIPRSRAERQSVSRPITRDRKLIKFRETSEEVIEKIRRKISWDLPEEISSPLIDEMKENYVDPTNEIPSEQPGSRRGSKDTMSYTPGSSPISGSPRTSVSRRFSGDQSSDRPIKPPLRKSSIKNTVSSSIETAQSTQDLKTPLPPPRKKSIGSSQKVRKSRKSSLDILLSEEKSLNYSKIAEDIRRTREESLKRLADSAKESRLPSQADENKANAGDINIVEGKESEEVTDRSRRRRRRPATSESETSEERPPEIRRRRSHYTSQESNESISPTTVSRNQVDEKVIDVTPRAAGRMHRKSVKYKSDGLPPRRLSKSSNLVADHDIPLVSKNSDGGLKDKLFVADELNKSDVKNTKIGLDAPVKLSDKINQGTVGLEKNIKKANIDNSLKSKLDKEEISTSTPVVGGKTYLDKSNNTVSIKNEKAGANKKTVVLERKSDVKNLSDNKTLKTEKDNKPLSSDSLKCDKLHLMKDSSKNKTSEINESTKIDKKFKIKTDSNKAGEKSLMKQSDSSVNTVVKDSIKYSSNKTITEINESTKIYKGIKMKTDSNKADEKSLMKQSDSSVNTVVKDSIKDSPNKTTSEINESTKIDKGIKIKTDSNKAGEKSLIKQSESSVNTVVKDSIKDSPNKTTSEINESLKIDKGVKIKTYSNKAGEKSLLKQSDSSDSSNKTSEINESTKIDKGTKIKVDSKIADEKTLLKQSDSSEITVVKDSKNEFSRTAKKDTDHEVALEKAKPEESKEEKPHPCNNLSQNLKDNSRTTITNLKSETKTTKEETLPSIFTKVEKIKYGERLNSLNEIKQGSSESLAKKLSKPITEKQQILPDPALKLKPNVPYTKETEEIVVVCKLPKKTDPGRKISIPNEQKVVVNIKGTELKTVDIIECSKESANGVTPKVSQIIPFGQPKDLELKNSNFSQSLGNTEILDVNVTHTVVLKPKASTSQNLDISSRKNEKEGFHLKSIPDVIKSTVNFRSKDSDDVSDIVKSTISKKEDKTIVKKLAVSNSKETFSPNIKTETDINVILDKKRTPDVISKEKNKKDLSTHVTFEEKLPSLEEKNSNKGNFSSVKKSNSSALDHLGEATALKLPNVEKSCSEVLSISKEPDLIQMTTVAAKTIKIDPFAIKKTEEGIKKKEIELPLKSTNEKNDVEKIKHERNVFDKTDNIKNKFDMHIKNDKNKTEKVNTEQKTAFDKVTNIKENGESDSLPKTDKTDNIKNKFDMHIKNDKNKTEKVNTEQKTAFDKVTNIKENGESDSLPKTDKSDNIKNKFDMHIKNDKNKTEKVNTEQKTAFDKVTNIKENGESDSLPKTDKTDNIKNKFDMHIKNDKNKTEKVNTEQKTAFDKVTNIKENGESDSLPKTDKKDNIKNKFDMHIKNDKNKTEKVNTEQKTAFDKVTNIKENGESDSLPKTDKTDNIKNKFDIHIKNDKNKTEKVNTEQKTAFDKVTNIKENGESDSLPTTQNVKCKLLQNKESPETVKELCIKNEDRSVISGQEKNFKKAEGINTDVTAKSSENEISDIKHPVQVYKKSMTSPNVDLLLKESDSSKTDVKSAVTKRKGKLEPASLSAGDVPNAVKSVQNIQLNDVGVKAVKSKVAETQQNSTRIDDSCMNMQVDYDGLQLPKLKTCEEKSSRDLETLKGKKSEISESDKKDLKSTKVSDNLKNTGNELKSEKKLENESKIINEKLSSESEDKSISNVLGKESENVCTGNIERPINVNKTHGVVDNSMPKINVTILENAKQTNSENFKLPILHDTSNNLSLSQEKNTSTSKVGGLQNTFKGNEVNEAEIKSSKHLDDKISNENKEPIVAIENKLHEPSGREISEEQLPNLKIDKLDNLRNTKDKHEENSLKQTLTEVIKAPEQIKAEKIKEPKLPAVPIRYHRFGLFTRPKVHQNTILESSSSEEESETETDTDSESCEEELPVHKASTLTNECNVVCHQKCEKFMPNLCGVNQKLLSEVLDKVKKGKYPEKNEKTRSHSETSNTSINSNSSNCTTYTTVPGSWDDEYGSPKKIEKSLKFRKYGVDDFIFLKLLGKGSFGKVLLAELKDTQMYFAIKCLKKDVVLEDDDVESTMIERRVLALGTQHPYMCKLYCTFQTKSYLYFVMEYLNGGDLMFHIQESGRFEEKRAMFYGAEIVSALKFLHKRGIVYRDIKLDNIILDEEGHVHLVDFGMCKTGLLENKRTSTFCGTPDYIPPEIVLGQKYNQSVDWWSFGVLLYEMLIGRSPFQGTDEDELFWSICNEEPHYPRFLSKEATHILGLLLVKCPSKRLGMPSCPAGDIKDHAFFSNVIWDKIENKLIPPVFKPSVSGPCDTSNFDSSFTMDSATLSPIESDVLKSMDQEQFNGFSYTNPHLTG